MIQKKNINKPYMSSRTIGLNTIFNGTLIGTNAITISTLQVSNNIDILGNLNCRNATFGSQVSMSGLYVSNNSLLNGTLILSSNATFGQNLSVSSLFVSHGATINDRLSVSSLNVTNNVNINGDLNVLGIINQIMYNYEFYNKIGATYTSTTGAPEDIYSIYLMPPNDNLRIKLSSNLQLYLNENDHNNIPFSSTITRMTTTSTINLANELLLPGGDITYSSDHGDRGPLNLDSSLGTTVLTHKKFPYMLSMIAIDHPGTTEGITYNIRVAAAHHNVLIRNGSLCIDYINP